MNLSSITEIEWFTNSVTAELTMISYKCDGAFKILAT
jgi:hypothetical protein